MNAIRPSKRKTKKKRKKKSAAQKYYERKKSDREEAIAILSSGAQDVTAKRDVGSGKIFCDHSANIRYSHGKKYLVAPAPKITSKYELPKKITGGCNYMTIRSENGVEISHKLSKHGKGVPPVFKLFIGKPIGKVINYCGRNFTLVKIQDENTYKKRVHENIIDMLGTK